jgi:hypothetical protein
MVLGEYPARAVVILLLGRHPAVAYVHTLLTTTVARPMPELLTRFVVKFHQSIRT